METVMVAWMFDSLLGLGLLWLAWQSLACSDLFKAIVLFIAFGLLMALAWVRLEAPDVALAEAAIGAGLTGALLMVALAQLQSIETNGDAAVATVKKGHCIRPLQWLLLIALSLMATGLGYVIISFPAHVPGLSTAVATHLEASGVSNPVTAVLLNFRGYDTLLELVVLLLALLGVWSLGGTVPQQTTTPAPLVLEALTRLLVPMLILTAAYLLWVGAHAPGGAFQAGSVLAAAGVLLLLIGRHPRAALMALPLRLILVLGPATFVAMAVVTMLIEGALLKFPPEHAGKLILLLETTAMLSIGATLAALFLGGRRHTDKEHS